MADDVSFAAEGLFRLARRVEAVSVGAVLWFFGVSVWGGSICQFGGFCWFGMLTEGEGGL
jgi:hypothetical protein